MAKILVTKKIPGKAFEKLLKSNNEVIVSQFDRVLLPQEIMEMGKEAEAVLTLLTDRWTGEMMDQFPALKIISNYAVGYDNIDIKAATERGIVVTNTPSNEVNESVAEFTWAMIFTLAKQTIPADTFAKRGLYKGWQPNIFLGHNLTGKTLGIVGLGRIGTMVALRAQGFEMKVLYHSKSKSEEVEKELGIQYKELDGLLAESDYVTLHVPLLAETKYLINAAALGKMKQGSYLINTARGGVVDEQALVEALKSGKLAGAALDVHENEPAMNPELMLMENVILTPHIASATVEVREKMTEQAVDAILKTLNGEMPENIVNKEVWSARRGYQITIK